LLSQVVFTVKAKSYVVYWSIY